MAVAELSEKERGLAALRRAGLLVDPPLHILAVAEEWRKRPKEERERIQAELRALRLDPPLRSSSRTDVEARMSRRDEGHEFGWE